MKQYGFTGKGTGKLGSSVFAISGGEQIVRQYNPVVSNPRTTAQTEQRAKFKLMTQLAAAMSGQIAFRKSGLTSARNKFVAANIKNAAITNGDAVSALTNLTLTGGNISISSLAAERTAETTISLALENAAPANVKRVVYVVYKGSEDAKLEFVGEKVVSEAGQNRTFETTMAAPNDYLIVYAYGIIENTSKAKVAFDNYNVDVNADESLVDVINSLLSSDYTLTATVADIISVQS